MILATFISSSSACEIVESESFNCLLFILSYLNFIIFVSVFIVPFTFTAQYRSCEVFIHTYLPFTLPISVSLSAYLSQSISFHHFPTHAAATLSARFGIQFFILGVSLGIIIWLFLTHSARVFSRGRFTVQFSFKRLSSPQSQPRLHLSIPSPFNPPPNSLLFCFQFLYSRFPFQFLQDSYFTYDFI